MSCPLMVGRKARLRKHLFDRSGSRGRLHDAAERAEIEARVTDLVEGTNLLHLQFSDFLGARPDHSPSRGVCLHHELKSPLHRATECLPQYLDDKFHAVVVIILQDDVIRRYVPRACLFTWLRFGRRGRHNEFPFAGDTWDILPDLPA